MPPAAAASRMALLCGTSHCRPKVIVPRHRLETRRPVRPNFTCFMTQYFNPFIFLFPGRVEDGGGHSGNPALYPSSISRTLLPRVDIAKGLVSTAMPGSRWPLPIAAFSA